MPARNIKGNKSRPSKPPLRSRWRSRPSTSDETQQVNGEGRRPKLSERTRFPKPPLTSCSQQNEERHCQDQENVQPNSWRKPQRKYSCPKQVRRNASQQETQGWATSRNEYVRLEEDFQRESIVHLFQDGDPKWNSCCHMAECKTSEIPLSGPTLVMYHGFDGVRPHFSLVKHIRPSPFCHEPLLTILMNLRGSVHQQDENLFVLGVMYKPGDICLCIGGKVSAKDNDSTRRAVVREIKEEMRISVSEDAILREGHPIYKGARKYSHSRNYDVDRFAVELRNNPQNWSAYYHEDASNPRDSRRKRVYSILYGNEDTCLEVMKSLAVAQPDSFPRNEEIIGVVMMSVDSAIHIAKHRRRTRECAWLFDL